MGSLRGLPGFMDFGADRPKAKPPRREKHHTSRGPQTVARFQEAFFPMRGFEVTGDCAGPPGRVIPC